MSDLPSRSVISSDPDQSSTGQPTSESRQVPFNEQTWHTMTSHIRAVSAELAQARQELAEIKRGGGDAPRAKAHKPGLFSGQSSEIEAWISCMDVYVKFETPDMALTVALTYLTGEAFAWWKSHCHSHAITTCDHLRTATLSRFNPIEKIR